MAPPMRRYRLCALSLLAGWSTVVDAFVPPPTSATTSGRSSVFGREGTVSRQEVRSAANVRRTTPGIISAIQIRTRDDNDDDDDGEACLVGANVVDSCSRPAYANAGGGTESQASVATNLAKCICGAGSFALPHVFLEEGVLGGTLALTACATLATVTMQSLSDSKNALTRERGEEGEAVTSYVQLARIALGEPAAGVVFGLTLAASLGVCSTYLVFVGSTLESMSVDATSQNIVRQLAPDVSEYDWEVASALVLYPLSLVRDYSIFAFTSALGVFAVVGGILVTLSYGILVDPGGGLSVAVDSIETLPLWPSSMGAAFGGSFGTICYLFAINFLMFPVMNSIREPERFDGAVSKAVGGVWVVNVIFSIIALGFYGDDTQDLILANLDNGPYLSALKLLLCVDLLFTFPIVFSSGRQILENALLGPEGGAAAADKEEDGYFFPARAAIVAGAVSTCFCLAQVGGFGAVANLVGGVAQGTLAFVMPPAIALALGKVDQERGGIDGSAAANAIPQYLLAAFGVCVVSAVTYFTFSEM